MIIDEHIEPCDHPFPHRHRPHGMPPIVHHDLTVTHHSQLGSLLLHDLPQVY